MIVKSDGFIIGRKIYRDSSLLLKFYSYDFGKVEGIVKGIRKIEDYGRYDGLITLFSNYEAVFYRRESNFALFTQFYLLNSYWKIVEDYKTFTLACLGLELLDYIMQPYETNIKVYQLLEFFLTRLSQLPKESESIIFCTFLIKLLKYSGFNPQINECITCRNRISQAGYFLPSAGGMFCEKCKSKENVYLEITAGTIKYINYLQGQSYSEIGRLRVSKNVKQELNELLYSFICYHICFLSKSWQSLTANYD